MASPESIKLIHIVIEKRDRPLLSGFQEVGNGLDTECTLVGAIDKTTAFLKDKEIVLGDSEQRSTSDRENTLLSRWCRR